MKYWEPEPVQPCILDLVSGSFCWELLGGSELTATMIAGLEATLSGT